MLTYGETVCIVDIRSQPHQRNRIYTVYKLTATYPSNAKGHADITATIEVGSLETVAQVVENVTYEEDANAVAYSLTNAFRELDITAMTFKAEDRTFTVEKV